MRSPLSARVDMDEPLGDLLPLVDVYQGALSRQATRLFYYLLVICTRESRHVHSFGDIEADLIAKYGPECAKFLRKHLSKGSATSVDTLRKNPPSTTMGKYTDFLVDVFYDGNFSGGYGGPKWGAVAKVLREFTHGRYSAEMMVDVGWTLCHNGGPIFNKGVFYHTYDKKALLKILDVQRAGMIPQGVATKALANISQAALAYQQHAEALLGQEAGGYVDWYAVEALGAVQKYSSEKKAQADAHGVPDSVAAALAKKAAAEKAEKAKAAAAAKAEADKYFHILPNFKLAKIKVRNEAAA